MKNRIITISREFGSGGRTIGREVAKTLNIPFYDSELIEKLAQESGFTTAYIQAQEEESGTGLFQTAFTQRAFGPTNQDRLFEIESRIIRTVAQQGDCVIVGRCADSILKEEHDLLTVFIHADYESRAKRIVDVYGERSEEPLVRLKEKDKRRAAYHRFYTDQKWGKAQNYDLCLNSGTIGISACVQIIVNLFEKTR